MARRILRLSRRGRIPISSSCGWKRLMGLLPSWLDTPFALIVLPVLLGGLIALPLISPDRRAAYFAPSALDGGRDLGIEYSGGDQRWLGTYDPWSPDMDAWSGTPTPVDYIKGRTPLEIQGAILIQAKQCRNCHSLGGSRRNARTGTGYYRDPADPQRIDPPDSARRRQYARVWQSAQARRSRCDRCLPYDDASRERTPRA